jgi:excisionase family DNA binding protein
VNWKGKGFVMADKPLLLSFANTAELLGISRALLYQMHNDGRLGPLPHKIGRRSLLTRAEIEAWVNAGLPPRIQWEKMK